MKKKFVRRANQWCITFYVTSTDGKTKTQHQSWFFIELEVDNFMKEQHGTSK